MAFPKSAVAATVAAAYFARRCLSGAKQDVKTNAERVAVLGASTTDGIGAAIAQEYVARGCGYMVLVARRQEALLEVKAQLVRTATTDEARKRAEAIVLVAADCTKEADVDRIRETIVADAGGIDTLHIVFGAVCRLPLLDIAGVDPVRGATSTRATPAGLACVADAIESSCNVNVKGTALVLASLVPIMQVNSKQPHVSVIGSLASLFPAPAVAVYCATKSAQQQLVLGVAAECETQAREPGRSLVTMNVLAPGSIGTSFGQKQLVGSREDSRRTLPHDGPRENPQLSVRQVAKEALRCVDHLTTGVVAQPHAYYWAWVVSLLWPSVTRRQTHAFMNY